MFARPTPHVSIREAAEHFGVSDRTIRRWISTGDLPALRIGPRTIRIRTADLDRAGVKIGGAA